MGGSLPSVWAMINIILKRIDKTYKRIEVDRQELLDALNIVSAVESSEWNQKILLSLFFKKGKILVESSADTGQAKSNVSMIFKGTQKDFIVALKCSYLLNAVKNIDTEKIIIKIKDGKSPVIVIPKSSEKYINVVLPMRIS